MLKLVFLYTRDGCLRESLQLLTGSSATCYVRCATRDALEPMQQNQASSLVYLGYTEMFCVPVVTSVYF